jgi:myo-inositol-1(or 4)-monophosphatase
MFSLAPCRSVDAGAAQLIVREAGGVVAFPDAGPDPMAVGLDLDMRSRLFAAPGPEQLDALVTTITAAAR